MAEPVVHTAGKPKKGKKGKLQPWQYLAGGGVVALAYYLYKKHSANTAASGSTTAAGAIDPNTGVPYAQETGANAINPLTGTTYASQTGTNAIDPLTGNTYASELSSLTGTGAIDPATGVPYSQETGGNAIDPLTGVPFASELASAQSAASSIVSGGSGGNPGANPGGPNNSPAPSPSGPGNASPTLNAWISATRARLQQAGLTSATANATISDYLKGIPIANPAAASKLASSISSPNPTLGAPPVKNGAHLPIVVAKSVSSTLTKAITTVTAPKMPVAKGPVKATPPPAVAKKKSGPPPVTKSTPAKLI